MCQASPSDAPSHRRTYETIRIRTNFRAAVLLPLPVQNLFSKHVLSHLKASWFQNRFCPGSGRRTPALKFVKNSYGFVGPPVVCVRLHHPPGLALSLSPHRLHFYLLSPGSSYIRYNKPTLLRPDIDNPLWNEAQMKLLLTRETTVLIQITIAVPLFLFLSCLSLLARPNFRTTTGTILVIKTNACTTMKKKNRVIGTASDWTSKSDWFHESLDSYTLCARHHNAPKCS